MILRTCTYSPFFFFNDTATTEIYTLSLHDALPIYHLLLHGHEARPACREHHGRRQEVAGDAQEDLTRSPAPGRDILRSEEHTSELQSRLHLVCRLLLEKKK